MFRFRTYTDTSPVYTEKESVSFHNREPYVVFLWHRSPIDRPKNRRLFAKIKPIEHEAPETTAYA
jgi:hypothetical protein